MRTLVMDKAPVGLGCSELDTRPVLSRGFSGTWIWINARVRESWRVKPGFHDDTTAVEPEQHLRPGALFPVQVFREPRLKHAVMMRGMLSMYDACSANALKEGQTRRLVSPQSTRARSVHPPITNDLGYGTVEAISVTGKITLDGLMGGDLPRLTAMGSQALPSITSTCRRHAKWTTRSNLSRDAGGIASY